MNACQALVTPDCAKPKVQKSTGMKTAIEEMLNISADGAMKARVAPLLNQTSLPNSVGEKVKIATMEFAEVKFTSTFSSGKQYLAYMEHKFYRSSLNKFLMLKKLSFVRRSTHTPQTISKQLPAARELQ